MRRFSIAPKPLGVTVAHAGSRAAHTRCFACRLGVADGGAAIRSSALKKLEGDATVDGAQRAKVSVRPPYHVDSSKRAMDGHLALVSMCCYKGWHNESIEWPGWAVHALCTAGHAGVRVTFVSCNENGSHIGG